MATVGEAEQQEQVDSRASRRAIRIYRNSGLPYGSPMHDEVLQSECWLQQPFEPLEVIDDLPLSAGFFHPVAPCLEPAEILARIDVVRA